MVRSAHRRRIRAASLAAALAALLIAVLITGCSGGSGGAGPTGSSGSTAPPAGDGDSIAEMLALLPEADGDETSIITITRWHAAARAYGIDVPGADASTEEIVDYVTALTLGEGGLTSASDLMSLQVIASQSTQEQFGFRRQDISAEATAGTAPRRPQAARGRFDADEIAQATADGPVGPDVEQVETDGVPVLRWREDFDVDLKQITALSRLGSAGRLAVPDESTLLYATYDQGIDDLIAAHDGGPSLADDRNLAAVARALDDQGALSALILGPDDGGGLTYLAAGIGWAYAAGDGDGGRMLLTYATGSAADARALADELEDLVVNGRTMMTKAPWSDYLTDPDIAVDGTQVVASFGVEGPAGRWAQFVYTGENLF
jgi:hypothetical protein